VNKRKLAVALAADSVALHLATGRTEVGDAVMVLAIGLCGLGMVAMLGLLLILFYEGPSKRLLLLVREVRNRSTR